MTVTNFDQLPKFAKIPSMFGNISSNKSNIDEKNWYTLYLENLLFDYFSIHWKDFLKIDELNVDDSTQISLDKVNMLLDTYVLISTS